MRLQITEAHKKEISYAQAHKQETSNAQTQMQETSNAQAHKQETYNQIDLHRKLFEFEHFEGEKNHKKGGLNCVFKNFFLTF